MINGLQYCHDKGICHRDLKPENLLVSSAGVLKISDFGLSSIVDIKHNQLLDNAVGTPKYIAPEVIRRDRYDGKAADCWSVGVILYVLLAGYYPFDEDSLLDLFRLIREAKVIYPYWFDNDLIDLLKKIFVYDARQRYTLTDIKNHKWTQKYSIELVGVIRNKVTNRVEEIISSRNASTSNSRNVSRSNSLEPGGRWSASASVIGNSENPNFGEVLKEATDVIITEENTHKNKRSSPRTIVISRPVRSHSYSSSDDEGIVLIEKDEVEITKKFLGIIPCCEDNPLCKNFCF